MPGGGAGGNCGGALKFLWSDGGGDFEKKLSGFFLGGRALKIRIYKNVASF